jgi:hypothetical protein
VHAHDLVLYLTAALAFGDGFVTRDGVRLTLDGHEYRAIGANQPDLFTNFIGVSTTLASTHGTPEKARQNSIAAVRDAEASGIAFFRFWASGFWPVEMKLYLEKPDDYWRQMDELFALCGEHHVKLVPSIFFNHLMWPDLCNEPWQAALDPESKTYKAMHRYAREIVSRYKTDTNVLAWEIGNEYSTMADLNWAGMPEAGGAGVADIGTRPKRVFEDSMTADMLRDFMQEMAVFIKSIDPNHLVTTGDAHPREHSWSLRESFPDTVWKKDTLRQFLSSLLASQPEPFDVMSIHHYGNLAATDGEPSIQGLSMHSLGFLKALVQCIHASRSPVFVGELGSVNPSLREDTEARHLQAALDWLDSEGVSLVAIWAWYFPWQPENTITSESHPLLIKRIAELNGMYAAQQLEP